MTCDAVWEVVRSFRGYDDEVVVVVVVVVERGVGMMSIFAGDGFTSFRVLVGLFVCLMELTLADSVCVIDVVDGGRWGWCR